MLTCSPFAFGTTLLSSMSHLFPNSILSTSSLACCKDTGTGTQGHKQQTQLPFGVATSRATIWGHLQLPTMELHALQWQRNKLLINPSLLMTS